MRKTYGAVSYGWWERRVGLLRANGPAHISTAALQNYGLENDWFYDFGWKTIMNAFEIRLKDNRSGNLKENVRNVYI